MKHQFFVQKVFRTVARQSSSSANNLWVQAYLKRAGVPRASKIFTYTTKQELHALFMIAFESPHNAVCLEIGSYTGASTCYLAAGLLPQGGRIFCVDTWNNETMPEGVRDTFAEFQNNIRGVAHMVTSLRSTSDEINEKDLALPLQLVFLDGDHSYEATKRDFERVVPWLSDDGVIAFHDCLYYEGVSRVIGEALATGQWAMAGLVGNLFWMKRAQFPW